MNVHTATAYLNSFMKEFLIKSSGLPLDQRYSITSPEPPINYNYKIVLERLSNPPVGEIYTYNGIDVRSAWKSIMNDESYKDYMGKSAYEVMETPLQLKTNSQGLIPIKFMFHLEQDAVPDLTEPLRGKQLYYAPSSLPSFGSLVLLTIDVLNWPLDQLDNINYAGVKKSLQERGEWLEGFDPKQVKISEVTADSSRVIFMPLSDNPEDGYMLLL